jgi:hypothetical protein
VVLAAAELDGEADNLDQREAPVDVQAAQAEAEAALGINPKTVRMKIGQRLSEMASRDKDRGRVSGRNRLREGRKASRGIRM